MNLTQNVQKLLRSLNRIPVKNISDVINEDDIREMLNNSKKIAYCDVLYSSSCMMLNFHQTPMNATFFTQSSFYLANDKKINRGTYVASINEDNGRQKIYRFVVDGKISEDIRQRSMQAQTPLDLDKLVESWRQYMPSA